jgi:hypothetical protein
MVYSNILKRLDFITKLHKKPYGFNDKVGTKKSNAKKYINDKL